jgi:hypothetical protein
MEGVFFFFEGCKLNNKKVTKIKIDVALDGCRSIFYMQQPTKNTWVLWRGGGIGCATGQGH